MLEVDAKHSSASTPTVRPALDRHKHGGSAKQPSTGRGWGVPALQSNQGPTSAAADAAPTLAPATGKSEVEERIQGKDIYEKIE